MRTKSVAVIAIVALCCLLRASGQEQKLKKADLPAAVQKTADEQSKGATVRGYSRETENGKVEYEVQLMVNGHSKDVTMDPQGNVMEVEEQVDLGTLPGEVRSGLKKQAGNAKIGKVESLTKHGTLVAYEAQVQSGKKHSEIQVGPDGKQLGHKE
ncbi:MAG TPA: hypothetical protein VGK24_20950 [Candidatus Angelobacter sp.]|jgi:uncharacterized membrane protein YkoI